jgi:phosphatidylinositol alpha 1,6-mannosyltransferase
MPMTYSLGHRSGSEQGFIIGMRMDEDQGFPHSCIVAYRPTVEITHVSDCYAPRTGGIETQVHGLVTQQRAAGDNVSVITATPGPADDAIRLSAGLPFELPIHPRSHRVTTEALERLAPDVVHVHVGAISPFAWAAVRAARDLRLPTVVTVHSMWGNVSRFGYGVGATLTNWPKWGVRVCAVSHRAAQSVAQVLGSEVGITPNGIDPGPWQTTGSPGAADPLHLVSVLRLAPRKRVLNLVNMFRQVQRLRPETRLTIIGDGPLKGLASARAGTMPIDFTGRLDRDGMLRVYGDAHVFWQPSVHESFGIAALEARSAGLPVIARSQSGTGMFITHGVNGWLDPSDAATVHRIVSLQPQEIQDVRATNLSTTAPVTWDRVLPLVQKQYELAQ